jgi:hypothetical protein
VGQLDSIGTVDIQEPCTAPAVSPRRPGDMRDSSAAQSWRVAV